ncbi:MAG: DUF1294 domain-containing protein [Lachnospiraceae bacterium]|nr:DUF1294 domain-containing protein [Lachnospiraceae bacterium]
MEIYPIHFFILYLLAVNVAAFLLFGADKFKASHGKWRVRERTLFLCAALGGSAGALLGMRHFHHKTRKPAFAVGIPAILLVQVILAVLFLFHHWAWLTS